MAPWVDPQMAKILAAMAAAPAVDFKTMPITEARPLNDAASAAWSADAPQIPARTFDIPRADGGVMRARLYTPVAGQVLPLIVFVHGGGWTFGSVDTHDGTMRTLAIEAKAAVLGFDYRLAPEHPFPAPLDDTLAAIDYALSGALGSDVSVEKWAIGGDSAGAQIALSAMIARRDAGKSLPATAALFYGCYAPIFDTASHKAFGEGYLLTSVNMRWYWGNYIGDTFGNPHPLAAPLNADVSGLPPLYLATAGLDPLSDDTQLLAQKLAAASVAYRHDHVPGVVHGCLRMSRKLDAAHGMLANAGAFVRGRIG